jgi:hypothetical protein
MVSAENKWYRIRGHNFGHEAPDIGECAVDVTDNNVGVAIVAHLQVLEWIDANVQMRAS